MNLQINPITGKLDMTGASEESVENLSARITEGEYQVFENHFVASESGNDISDKHNSESSHNDCLT